MEGVLRKDGARMSVRFERELPASPAEVWAALTEPESIARWLDPRCEAPLTSGDELRVRGPDGEEVTTRLRELEPRRVLELDWDSDGDVSTVRFELSGEGAETVLVLAHRRMDAQIGMAYAAAWSRAADRLLEAVER